MKVQTIQVVNYKALKGQKIDFNGASAIITAGNNVGKTSFLRGLIDRFHGEKPDIIVTKGEEKGVNLMTLTDGSKIEWAFTEKTERFSFTTADDIKMTTGVLSAIGFKYFGVKFDIDKFMRSSKKDALKMVQTLLGIDLSVIDNKHAVYFAERTDANRELKRISNLNKEKPLVIEKPDIYTLKQQKEERINENKTRKENWVSENENHQQDALNFNKSQNSKKDLMQSFLDDWNALEKYTDTDNIKDFIDFEGMSRFYKNMQKPKELKEVTTLVEPKYHEFEDIDLKIENALLDKAKFDTYETDLTTYNNWVQDRTNARTKVADLNTKLDELNLEKLKLIKEAKLPSEFEMTDDGLLYKGLPIDDNQISSSAKYICALKLGALSLGKIRTMHFDASYLDNISLGEIQDWAELNDLQLLIERPELKGGEIKYDIISK